MVLVPFTEKTSLATWYPIQSNSITRLDRRHLWANSNHFTRSFVTKYTRKARGMLPGYHVLVTVTDARCAHFDQNFTIKRIGELQGLYLYRSADAIKGYSSYLHLVPPSP
jgi:hypothetical protein